MRAAIGLFAFLAAGAAVLACESSDNSGGTIPDVDSGLPDTGTQPTNDGGTNPDGRIDPTPDELAARGNCVAPTGAGTPHSGAINADETWTAAASPHHVTFDLDIHAKVTIEPCAVVVVDKGYRITVGSTTGTGAIVAKGTAQMVDGKRDIRPVTFDAADPANPWAQIVVQPKATLDLSVASIQNGGGDTNNYRGALVVLGDAGGTVDAPIVQSTTLDRVLIEKSGSYGLNLLSWGALTATSDKLWIRNSGVADFPSAILIEPGVASTLPKTIVATGNVKNEILMQTSKSFSRNDTLVNRGLPYRMKGALSVHGSTDGAPVKLTIEAGVTLAFESNASSGMYIGTTEQRQGILEAVGTAAAPITFTSAKDTKAPGDWMGLYFKNYPVTGNKISHAKIEYAGGESLANGFGCGPGDNDAAVLIFGNGANQVGPSNAFIDNTSFENIGGMTVIVSGWVDGDSVDMSQTNTFGANVPACHVSQSRPQSNDCTGRDTCR